MNIAGENDYSTARVSRPEYLTSHLAFSDVEIRETKQAQKALGVDILLDEIRDRILEGFFLHCLPLYKISTSSIHWLIGQKDLSSFMPGELDADFKSTCLLIYPSKDCLLADHQIHGKSDLHECRKLYIARDSRRDTVEWRH